jgi:hypothetical protein
MRQTTFAIFISVVILFSLAIAASPGQADARSGSWSQKQCRSLVNKVDSLLTKESFYNNLAKGSINKNDKRYYRKVARNARKGINKIRVIHKRKCGSDIY